METNDGEEIVKTDNRESSDNGEPMDLKVPINNIEHFSTAYAAKLDMLSSSMERLESEFRSKIKYDKHKELIIDKLHGELQEYKNNLVKKLIQPIVMDIIHLMDDINKLVMHHAQKDPSLLDSTKLLELIKSIPSDLQDILEKQGVESYGGTDKIFTPAYQRIAGTVVTADQSKDKTVSKTVRTGYMWEGNVIRPEMVEVYIYKNAGDDININQISTQQGGGAADGK